MNLLEPPPPFGGHAGSRSWERDVAWPQVVHAWRHATSRNPSRTNPDSVVHTGPDLLSQQGHTISIVTDKAHTGILTVWRNEPGVSAEEVEAKQKAIATANLQSKTKANTNRKKQRDNQKARGCTHPETKTCKFCR